MPIYNKGIYSKLVLTHTIDIRTYDTYDIYERYKDKIQIYG